jgi:hypothetical protein
MPVTNIDVVNYRGWDVRWIGRSCVIIYDPDVYIRPETLTELAVYLELSGSMMQDIGEAVCVAVLPVGCGYDLCRNDVIHTCEPVDPVVLETHLSLVSMALEVEDMGYEIKGGIQ